MLSPGVALILPPLPGVPLAFPLRNLPDLDRLKAASQTRGTNAAVIGAGFIGIEVAENLREAGKHVTLWEGKAALRRDRRHQERKARLCLW